jgi:hypothetical protein
VKSRLLIGSQNAGDRWVSRREPGGREEMRGWFIYFFTLPENKKRSKKKNDKATKGQKHTNTQQLTVISRERTDRPIATQEKKNKRLPSPNCPQTRCLTH